MRELLVRICIVAALATSGCGAKDTDKSDCRAERGACAVTADCCDGLICDKHACTTPGASMMTPSPVCGNGSCEAGESGATCCSDCGCPSGKQCKANSCQSDGTGGNVW